MEKRFAFAALLFSLSLPLLPQANDAGTLRDGAFTDPELGFRYILPKGLNDETTDARESLRRHADALGTSNTLDILLRMTSGPDDSAPDWHAVSIETYSRSKIAARDDAAVEAKMNVWVAGAGVSAVGGPESMSIGEKSFVVSNYEKSEPPLLKHARVYCTIRKGKLLAFAFTANSADKIDPIAGSLQTLQFDDQSATSHLGFDRNEYPGDQNLKDLRAAFSYTGYWLNNPPGSNTNTWIGKRDKLEAAGFGFLVVFNGRLYRDLGSVATASLLGKADAERAAQVAKREGFPAQTIIFLDQEEGGRLLPEQKAYLFAWADGVSQNGFRAGVYCSGIAAKEKSGESVVTAEDIRQNAGGRPITYWVTNDVCPPSPGCVTPRRPPSPRASGIGFADVWQFAQSPKRKDVAASCGGYHADGNCYAPGDAERGMHLDLNTAGSLDPSYGRTR